NRIAYKFFTEESGSRGSVADSLQAKISQVRVAAPPCLRVGSEVLDDRSRPVPNNTGATMVTVIAHAAPWWSRTVADRVGRTDHEAKLGETDCVIIRKVGRPVKVVGREQRLLIDIW